MASILKKIVGRFNTGKQEVAPERVFVAAFGKHPGWDDHIDDIGLASDVLVAAKRILYVQGIGGNVDSGSWAKLKEDQGLAGFRHSFVWCMEGSVLVGRLWSSRDGKGRTSYPMIVCVQCCGLPLDWIFENVPPFLEKIERICVGTTSPAAVRGALEDAQEELRRVVQQKPFSGDSESLLPGALARLDECHDMAMGREGLLRIVYHIEREVTRYQREPGKSKVVRPSLLRVPVASPAMPQRALLWMSFLLGKVGNSTPVLVLMPVEGPWMDIIIGEPTDLQLFCLLASLKTTPLTSSIPYNMDSEFVERTNQLIEQENLPHLV